MGTEAGEVASSASTETSGRFEGVEYSLWGCLADGLAALRHGPNEERRREIRNLLHLDDSSFWATLTVLAGLWLGGALLDRLLDGGLGLAWTPVGLGLAAVFLEWTHQSAAAAHRPIRTAHFDALNLIRTQRPDRRIIPKEAMEPDTPGPAAQPKGELESASGAELPRDKAPLALPAEAARSGAAGETAEERRRREEFERARDAHYDMSHVFRLKYDDDGNVIPPDKDADGKGKDAATDKDKDADKGTGGSK